MDDEAIPLAGIDVRGGRIGSRNHIVCAAERGWQWSRTRDAIAVAWTYEGRRIELVDTAGLRRRANVAGRLEAMAGGDTRRAVFRFCFLMAQQ